MYDHGVRLEDIVEHFAHQTPEALAVVQGDNRLTYADLHRAALGVARRMQTLGVGPGAIVPAVMSHRPEIFTVALGIMRCGAAYSLLDPWWPKLRIDEALERTGASLVVGEYPSPGRKVVPVELLLEATPMDGLGGPPRSSDSRAEGACVFFTSGSTGGPKGVLVPHRGVVRALTACAALPYSPTTVHLAAAPLPWDGLALEMWAPLVNGGTCVLRAPGPAPVDAVALRDHIAEGVNTVFLPSPLMAALVEDSIDVFDGLDMVVTGGSRAPVGAARSLLHRFPELHLVNAYGPTENSVLTSAHVVRASDVGRTATEIPIGAPLSRTSIYLIDDRGALALPGSVGEIVTGGDGVAMGYVREGRAVQEAGFVGSLNKEMPHGQYYRTGDLAEVGENGELLFRGRRDRQLKLSGVRVEPGELEHLIESLPQVASCAVSLSSANSDRLVCAYTTHDGRSIDAELQEFLQEKLLPVMRPHAVRHVLSLPLGPNGKLDQLAFSALFSGHERGQVWAAEADDFLIEVADLLDRGRVDYFEDLLDGGMSSLDAVRLAARLSVKFASEVSVADIFRYRSIAAVAGYCERRDNSDVGNSAPPGEKRLAIAKSVPSKEGEMSATVAGFGRAQAGFVFSEATSRGSADHVVVEVFEIVGELDAERFERCLKAVFSLHDALRSRLTFKAGMPSVQITDESSFSDHFRHEVLEMVCDATPQMLADRTRSEFGQQAHGGASFRLCRFSKELSFLAVAVHHAFYDGRSESIVVSELAALYRDGESLKSIRVTDTFARFVRWESANLPALVAQRLPHWQSRLVGPQSSPVPSVQHGELGVSELFIPAPTVESLKRAASRSGGPPISALIAATGVGLHRLQQFAPSHVGMVTDGRYEGKFDDVVGSFANTLPIALGRPPADVETWYLERVCAEVVDALTYSLPLRDLLRILRPPRVQAPWLQALVVLHRPRPNIALNEGTFLRHCQTRAPSTQRVLSVSAFAEQTGGWMVLVEGVKSLPGRADLNDIAAAVSDQLSTIAAAFRS